MTIEETIKNLEQRLKDAENDQFTDDAMDTKTFQGYKKAFDEIMQELKKLV
jgi:predicted  nucleic acid-binding Zn-ribbon protein